jgi:hypothetical protein
LPLIVLAILFGITDHELGPILRWVAGTLLVAVVLLICVASALLVADRVARRWWNIRPYPLRRVQLIPASLGVALLLVAGFPATEPIVAGLAAVAVVLAGLVALGAALNL